MQSYIANLICKEPVSNGFSCDTEDAVSFSHAGETLTISTAEHVLNNTDAYVKRCWKCFGSRWKVRSITSIGQSINR